jgi:hypothetical protein
VSSDIERRLREAREIVPGPDEDATDRGRSAALAAITLSTRPRLRSGLVLALALVLATALGVGIGALVAPSGTAAEPPKGIGFLPAEGWFVTQNANEATEQRPAHSIASTVPLQPGDGGSIVPYATLLGLPRDGIVVVASFVRSESLPDLSYRVTRFPLGRLPLRVDDAAPFDELGSLIRPERPLGQYQLEAEISGYSVTVNIYFGTQDPSPELRDSAQSQLEQLIVAPAEKTRDGQRAPGQPSESVTMRLVLRHFDPSCRCYVLRFRGTVSSGGAGEYVAVVRQGCGYSYGTAVIGTETREGGVWEADVVSSPYESADFRARWKTSVSAPVTVRDKVLALPIKTRGTKRYKVLVNAVGTKPRLEGRVVLLQRHHRGEWRTVQRARLRRDSLGGYSAMFTVAQRGWTLRGFVPARTVAPCFEPTATKRFVS